MDPIEIFLQHLLLDQEETHSYRRHAPEIIIVIFVRDGVFFWIFLGRYFTFTARIVMCR